jgi:F420H(2)-dependent quinone reductase
MTTSVIGTIAQVRDQVARYVATDGGDGGELHGRPVVILTTAGARSGSLRKPIMRVERDGVYAAIAPSGSEKQRWWDTTDAINPNYARYRASSGRDIPVLALEPAQWPED